MAVSCSPSFPVRGARENPITSCSLDRSLPARGAQQWLFRVFAAVLHIGNVKFSEHPTDSDAAMVKSVSAAVS